MKLSHTSDSSTSINFFFILQITMHFPQFLLDFEKNNGIKYILYSLLRNKKDDVN